MTRRSRGMLVRTTVSQERTMTENTPTLMAHFTLMGGKHRTLHERHVTLRAITRYNKEAALNDVFLTSRQPLAHPRRNTSHRSRCNNRRCRTMWSCCSGSSPRTNTLRPLHRRRTSPLPLDQQARLASCHQELQDRTNSNMRIEQQEDNIPAFDVGSGQLREHLDVQMEHTLLHA